MSSHASKAPSTRYMNIHRGPQKAHLFFACNLVKNQRILVTFSLLDLGMKHELMRDDRRAEAIFSKFGVRDKVPEGRALSL